MKKNPVTVTDKTGFETLEAIKIAANFNKWMYQTIAPYCRDNILEIGSGIGNISHFLSAEGYTISLSDTDDYYLDILRDRFSNSGNVKEILSIDMQHPDFTRVYSGLREKYDCIIMLNVLEHLADENNAVANCHFMLKPGGELIILVPAYAWLYARLDKELGHKKRYTAGQLNKLLTHQYFQVTRSFYFNAIGIMGWLYGKLARLKKITVGEIGLFDHLTVPGKWIDRIISNKAGLSVICVAKKTDVP